MTPHHCWRTGRGLPACGDSFPKDLALKLADRIATCSEILGGIAEGEGPVILTIPDIRQQESSGCGRAALEAVCEFHGVALPGWVADLPNIVQGLNPDTMEAILWRVMGNVCRGSMDVDALRFWTRKGRPVLCPITDPVLGGHWVICCGLDRTRIHLHCPVVGPKAVKLADWSGMWHDEAAGNEYRAFGLTAWPG